MRRVIIIALILLFGCVSVRVITGNKNTSDREATGLETNITPKDSL